MNYSNPNRIYTHYLPNDTSNNNITISSSHRIKRPISPATSRTAAATTGTSSLSGTTSATIDHYLERLNRNYRQIMSASSDTLNEKQSPSPSIRPRNSKHSYDLYNNDDFYIRKYGDFYMSGTGQGATTTTTSNNRSSRHRARRDVVSYCDLHSPGYHRHDDYEDSNSNNNDDNDDDYSGPKVATMTTCERARSIAAYQRYCDKVFFVCYCYYYFLFIIQKL